ncbi:MULTISPECIES: 3-phosphoglycerate dehydrogenase family protein [Gordonibacter]|uniref:D-3-phosphoglycerate dehydrogenase n=1 Tax=Gordonibacter faecis TaxID=3047475 RepID=A0ABT7DJ40_9ACTN|nr:MULTISPECIES: 3-phosphoglycerate dehydrogenase family protein [unclassified Gordonibacter]MDJ1649539.1 3-phosphoglycerate dehydrogenase family protein [Gordonibacter sp. KGMB12511]HIW75052.1 3-phosphoglycerate dehydrogenase [Candidatus Gordonibacter avicola]
MRFVHCLNNISSHGTDLLTDAYELTDDPANASAILVRSAAMHDMEFGDELLAIARAGAGVNNIPLDRCAEEGIVVFNTPGANANAVKEIVLCALLLASRGIVEGIEWCRANAEDENIAKAAEKAKKAFAGREIMGKKLGVIGLGAIGAEVANTALDLGMDVYGYDPYVSVGAAWRLSSAVHHVTNLDDLLRTCDYLTIHVPAVEGTIGMIDERACDLMKEGAVLLNFSRDTLVNNDAMAAALASGKVGAYVTDFAVPAVMQMERTIVLPHLGASTAEAEDNCAAMAVRQTMDYLENGTIKNSVNYPACDMGPVPEGLRRVAVLHANVPSVIAQVTNVFGDAGVNIENMTNKARGENAYTMLDLDAGTPGHPDDAIDRLSAIEGVRRVRVVR